MLNELKVANFMQTFLFKSSGFKIGVNIFVKHIFGVKTSHVANKQKFMKQNCRKVVRRSFVRFCLFPKISEDYRRFPRRNPKIIRLYTKGKQFIQ